MKGKKSFFKTFCLESSILGLKYLYLYPDKISRCFWTLNLVAVLYCACMLTILLYRRFEQAPTRISIENQFEPLANLSYPAITLCSPNQISKSSLMHFNRTLVDGNMTKNLETIVPQLLGFHHGVLLDHDSLRQLQSLIDLNRYTITEVMASLPQGCSRFLKKCFFLRKPVRCQDLFKPILTTHGLCCIFNSVYRFKDKRRNEKDLNFVHNKVNVTGLFNALTVVTDFEPEDAVDGTILFGGATRVMVTDWLEFPADDESALVMPHVESYHALHATYTYCSQDVKDLNEHSRKCYFKDEHRLPFFQEYHNSDCDLLCLTSAVQHYCHCQLFYLPHLKLHNVCNMTSISCIFEVKLQLNRGMEVEQCRCPRDCDSRRYTVQLSLGNLHAMQYMIKNPYPGMIFNSSTSIMHFFFPTSTHTLQKQETVLSITTLASNLGGVFGLCLGCSVMSVLEVFFYIYLGIRNHVKHHLRRVWHRKIGYCE